MENWIQPRPAEYGAFFKLYIDRVMGQDVFQLLIGQVDYVRMIFRDISEEKAESSYAKGKWTMKEVLGHITDTDKIMHYRALCIARGEKKPLPGFDQNLYVAHARFNEIKLNHLLDDFERNRHSIASFFRNLSEDAFHKIGNANGFDISVSALLHIIVGHFDHHMTILMERYPLENQNAPSSS